MKQAKKFGWNTMNFAETHTPPREVSTHPKNQHFLFKRDLTATAPKPRKVSHLRKRLTIAATLLGIVILGGAGARYFATPAVPPLPATTQSQATMLSANQFEERYGIKITLLAVTGGGGLVDFRYRIVDPEKAKTLLQNHHSQPTLLAMDSGMTLNSTEMGMKHHVRVKRNAVPFTFYPNVRNAIKPGLPVSVLFRDVRVGPIIAQ